jgi:lysophospholipase L1-like esterase
MSGQNLFLIRQGTPYDLQTPVIQTRSGISPSIMFIGDSRAYLGGTFDSIPNTVYNSGIVGSTTSGVIYTQLKLIKQYMPSYIFMFTGVNDILLNDSTGIEFKRNIMFIISYIKSLSITIVMMDQTINPVYGGLSPQHQACHDAMINSGIIYLAINYVESDFTDGAHLTSSGYNKVMSAINIYLGN